MAPTTLTLLLLLIAGASTAHPSSNSTASNSRDDLDDDGNPYGTNFNAATAILIVVLISAFFFLAFFSVYFRRCSRDRSAVLPLAAAASRLGGRGPRGLDPAILATFPTITYSAATGLKIGKESLECAICLSEFAGDDALRMLPRCCHVFHPECIDTWLETHVTCPVCRDNLSVIPSAGEEEEEEKAQRELERVTESDAEGVDLTRMGRSHTMGHVSGGGDRFTLRLPEHVRREMVRAGSLRRSASVAVFRGGGEGSSRRGYRGGERSMRWTTAAGILARVSTWRRGEAEGSSSAAAALATTKVSEGSARGGMFNCLGGGGGAEDEEEEAICSTREQSSSDVADRV